MCLSNHTTSRLTKEKFHKLYDSRILYTKSKNQNNQQLSQFIICMMEYMQRILDRKVRAKVTQEKSIFSCLPCCSNQVVYRNVRKEFQKAFENCKSEEQLEYYRQFVDSLTQKTSESFLPQAKPYPTESKLIQNEEQESSFNVLVKGSITWSNNYTMKIIPNKFCLLLKSEDEKQTLINLKNYILRQSNSLKENSFVVQGIVPIDPIKLRFSIPSDSNKNPMSIISKIKYLAKTALQENVKHWKKPISHIRYDRFSKLTEKKPAANNIFRNQSPQENTKKKQSSPVNTGGKQLNDPIMNKFKVKAKLGIVKKAQEYQETLQDAQSKQDRSSVKQPKNLFEQQLKIPYQFDAQNEQQEPNNIFANVLGGLAQGNTNQNDNKNYYSQQAFKKKPKSPLSATVNQPTIQLPKRKPSMVQRPQNYAMRPQDTRSESGLKTTGRQNISSAQSLKKLDMQPPDSGKSLINQLQQVIIQEQQQFGNASQLSQSIAQSFQTIPEKIF